MVSALTLLPQGSGRKTRQEDGALMRGMGGEIHEDPGPYLEVGTSHPPGAVVHPPQTPRSRDGVGEQSPYPHSGWGHGLRHPLVRATFLH